MYLVKIGDTLNLVNASNKQDALTKVRKKQRDGVKEQLEDKLLKLEEREDKLLKEMDRDKDKGIPTASKERELQAVRSEIKECLKYVKSVKPDTRYK